MTGGAMGWTPDQVRAHSLSDLAAAVEGYQLRNGGKPPMRESDVEALESLMARYPDEARNG